MELTNDEIKVLLRAGADTLSAPVTEYSLEERGRLESAVHRLGNELHARTRTDARN